MKTLLLASLIFAGVTSAAEPAALTLEYQVPLGDVRGRIDHLAVDAVHGRVFVAEIGSDSVGVIDIGTRRLLRTLTGLKEPQGVGYEPGTDTLFVANASDGSVRLFRGPDYMPAGQIDLGSDADNVRVDVARHQVLVGHSDGAITTIDAPSARVIGSIRLRGHPESFQLDPGGRLIWVNIPDVREIAVLDRGSGAQAARWMQKRWGGNFPMALDSARNRILVVFRRPAKAAIFQGSTGTLIASTDTCEDSDDVFIDSKRHRAYVTCGEGYVDVLGESGGGYIRLDRITTIKGARTSLYSSELDRLMVAVRADGRTPAGIWVFKPSP